jgi:parallel beta-helix repeat protein
MATPVLSDQDYGSGAKIKGLSPAVANGQPLTFEQFQINAINVRSWGAVGNGVADDTAAIQTAAATGRSLYFPAGTYRINDSGIALQSGCTYSGDGKNSVILYYERPQPSTIGFPFYAWGKTGVGVSGLHFKAEGAGAMTIAYNAGVNFYDSSSCSVTKCFFSDWKAMGVYCYGAEGATARHITVRDCVFSDWVPNTGSPFGAIHFGNWSESCKALDNEISGESYIGVACYDGYYGGTSIKHRISGNTIENQHGYGIAVYCTTVGTNVGIIITENRIRNIKGTAVSEGVKSFGAGIYCVNADGLTISENTISNCNILTDNESLAPGAIGVSSCYGEVVITDNTIFDTTWNGLRLTSNYLSDNRKGSYTVQGNKIRNAGKEGIYLNTLRNVTFSGNTASNSGETGKALALFYQCDDSIIDHNVLLDTSLTSAAALSLTNSSGTFFEGNKVTSASPANYNRLHDLTGCRIRGNTFDSGNINNAEPLYFQHVVDTWIEDNQVNVPGSNILASFYQDCTGSIVNRGNGWAASAIDDRSTGRLVIELDSNPITLTLDRQSMSHEQVIVRPGTLPTQSVRAWLVDSIDSDVWQLEGVNINAVAGTDQITFYLSSQYFESGNINAFFEVR